MMAQIEATSSTISETPVFVFSQSNSFTNLRYSTADVFEPKPRIIVGVRMKKGGDFVFSKKVHRWLLLTIFFVVLTLLALAVALVVNNLMGNIVLAIISVLTAISAVVWIDRAKREYRTSAK